MNIQLKGGGGVTKSIKRQQTRTVEESRILIFDISRKPNFMKKITDSQKNKANESKTSAHFL
jgi:hypothetical protein